MAGTNLKSLLYALTEAYQEYTDAYNLEKEEAALLTGGRHFLFHRKKSQPIVEQKDLIKEATDFYHTMLGKYTSVEKKQSIGYCITDFWSEALKPVHTPYSFNYYFRKQLSFFNLFESPDSNEENLETVYNLNFNQVKFYFLDLYGKCTIEKDNTHIFIKNGVKVHKEYQLIEISPLFEKSENILTNFFETSNLILKGHTEERPSTFEAYFYKGCLADLNAVRKYYSDLTIFSMIAEMMATSKIGFLSELIKGSSTSNSSDLQQYVDAIKLSGKVESIDRVTANLKLLHDENPESPLKKYLEERKKFIEGPLREHFKKQRAQLAHYFAEENVLELQKFADGTNDLGPENFRLGSRSSFLRMNQIQKVQQTLSESKLKIDELNFLTNYILNLPSKMSKVKTKSNWLCSWGQKRRDPDEMECLRILDDINPA